MLELANRQQAEVWNGYEGLHWADHADRYDAVYSGFNEGLLTAAAIADGERVLDIGCGTGELTRLAARAAASGSAIGLDISVPMLSRARAVAVEEGVHNVAFINTDAQVHPFREASFDVVVSRFGVMFFSDPIAAFTNVGRAVRPGGRLAFVCMRAMADHDVGRVIAAMRRDLPLARVDADVPPGGPLFLVDPRVIRDVLTFAGFAEIAIKPVDASQIWGRDAVDAAEFLAEWGPVRHLLRQVDTAARMRARSALTVALEDYERDGAVRLRGAGWLVTAGRP